MDNHKLGQCVRFTGHLDVVACRNQLVVLAVQDRSNLPLLVAETVAVPRPEPIWLPLPEYCSSVP